MELEGLRGLAAIAVVVFHALVIFYPTMFYGIGHPFSPIQHMRFEDNVFNNPLSVFFSGAFAVAIFFVLSGFVLTIGFFQKDDDRIIKKLAAKRYLRLMIPALTSILIIWLVLQLGMDKGKGAAEAITHAGSSTSLWAFNTSFFDAIQQGVWGIFTKTLETFHYNPVLWTMQFEFIGSFMVFAVALLFGRSRHRWLVYFFILLFTWKTWYFGFIIGMIFADLYSHKQHLFKDPKAVVVSWFALLIGLLLGGYPYVAAKTGFYEFIRIKSYDDGANLAVFATIGASLLIYSALTLPWLVKLLSRPVISNLGKYTFALYLTHLTVLFTVCLSLFTWLYPIVGFNRAAVMAILASTPVIIWATIFFERYVDKPAIELSGKFVVWFDQDNSWKGKFKKTIQKLTQGRHNV